MEFQNLSCSDPEEPVMKMERPLIREPGAETIVESGGCPWLIQCQAFFRELASHHRSTSFPSCVRRNSEPTAFRS